MRTESELGRSVEKGKYKMFDRFWLIRSIQKLFGAKAIVELKDSQSLPVWRKYLIKTLNANLISINETIVIRDEDWINSIEENIRIGKLRIKRAKSIDDAISIFSATLIEQSFLQIGFMPNGSKDDSVNLHKRNWKFDCHRSVLIVQNPEQIESLFWSSQQTKIGFDAQLKLTLEYRNSKSRVPYSEWCKQRKTEPIAPLYGE